LPEVDLPQNDPSAWLPKLFGLPPKIEAVRVQEAVNRASRSERFLLYKVLVSEHNSTGFKPLPGNLNFSEIRWLLRLRGELLFLNYRPWQEREDFQELCCLCNSSRREDIFHFLAECPMLLEVRLLHLGEGSLTRERITHFLTDSNSCRPLLSFARHAWRVRYEWMSDISL